MTDELDHLQCALLDALAAETAARPSSLRFVKAVFVVQRAMTTLGLASPEVERALWDERQRWDGLDRLLETYDLFAALVRTGVWVEGQGTWGGDDYVQAHPMFLECRLTERGRQRFGGLG